MAAAILRQSLGRRAFASTSLALQAPPAAASSKSQGILGSILHGSEEAKEEGRLDLQSHSRMVARGKYIHQIVKHQVKPGRTEEYKDLIGKYYGSIGANKELPIKLTGSWEVVVGELDTFYHILEFDDGYKGYDKSRPLLQATPEYKEMRSNALPLVNYRESFLGQEFAFWSTSPPVDLGGVYEMRIYNLRPGALLEWETEWRQGLEARRQHHEPIAAFFSQLGALHQVVHIWHYKDLQSRKELREKAWSVKGWSETVSKTVKLTVSMQANIMRALPFSPIR